MSATPKVRFYLTVRFRGRAWRYAVDVKTRRIDGRPITLVDYLPGEGQRPRYVGRFDPSATDEAEALLLSDSSAFRPTDIEYRAAAYALLRIRWADESDLPAGVSIDIEPAPGYSADVVATLAGALHPAA